MNHQVHCLDLIYCKAAAAAMTGVLTLSWTSCHRMLSGQDRRSDDAELVLYPFGRLG